MRERERFSWGADCLIRLGMTLVEREDGDCASECWAEVGLASKHRISTVVAITLSIPLQLATSSSSCPILSTVLTSSQMPLSNYLLTAFPVLPFALSHPTSHCISASCISTCASDYYRVTIRVAARRDYNSVGSARKFSRGLLPRFDEERNGKGCANLR